MFSGNIFAGTLNIDIVKPSMKKKKKKKKKITSKKALEDDMTQTVNKCVKSKIQTTVKTFNSLEICRLLECVKHRIKLY